MQPQIKKTVLALALGISLVGNVSAAMQTVSGTHVDFSFDDTLLGLFGLPSIVGDSLFFTPTTFVAQSSNGTPSLVLTNSTINLMVTAKTGYLLDTITLNEGGDYLLYAPLGASPMGVDVSGQMRVRNMSNLAETTTASILPTTAMTISGLPTHNWEAMASSDIRSWEAMASNLTIENLLIAYTTEAPSLAFVEKKFAIVAVDITPVPEPETWAMLVAGLGLVGMQLRRRSKRDLTIN